MPKKQKVFVPSAANQRPISPAVHEALSMYYGGLAKEGKPLIPLDQCRLQLKMTVLVVDHALRYMASSNPFGMSSFGKRW